MLIIIIMEINKKTISIVNDKKYTRPKHTIQDKITEDEIKEVLEDYIECDDVSKVPIGTHLRYFITTTNQKGNTERKFRFGGFLKNKDNCDKYIILTNNTISWSVQVDATTFFKKMNMEEIKEEYIKVIEEKHQIIKSLKKEIKKLNK
jgi:hypothetical protein